MKQIALRATSARPPVNRHRSLSDLRNGQALEQGKTDLRPLDFDVLLQPTEPHLKGSEPRLRLENVSSHAYRAHCKLPNWISTLARSRQEHSIEPFGQQRSLNRLRCPDQQNPHSGVDDDRFVESSSQDCASNF